MRTGVVGFAARHGASRAAQIDIALAVSEALTELRLSFDVPGMRRAAVEL